VPQKYSVQTFNGNLNWIHTSNRQQLV